MAGEVGLQSDVYLDGAAKPRTLHLKNLRRQWQILALQIIATVALIGMYLEVVSTYVVGSIDHTILFDSIELLISDQLPLGDWLTGEGRTGMARFFVPLVLGLGFGGVMAFIAFQSPKVQQRIKLGFIVGLIVLLVGRLVLSWFAGMLFSFDLRLPTNDELETLQWPLLMIMSLMILFIYLLPVIMGTRGIWGFLGAPLPGPSDSRCCFWAFTPSSPSRSSNPNWGPTVVLLPRWKVKHRTRPSVCSD